VANSIAPRWSRAAKYHDKSRDARAAGEIAALTTHPLQASQLAYSPTRVGDTLL
jgi:hypothetical protein